MDGSKIYVIPNEDRPLKLVFDRDTKVESDGSGNCTIKQKIEPEELLGEVLTRDGVDYLVYEVDRINNKMKLARLD